MSVTVFNRAYFNKSLLVYQLPAKHHKLTVKSFWMQLNECHEIKYVKRKHTNSYLKQIDWSKWISSAYCNALMRVPFLDSFLLICNDDTFYISLMLRLLQLFSHEKVLEGITVCSELKGCDRFLPIVRGLSVNDLQVKTTCYIIWHHNFQPATFFKAVVKIWR